MREVFRCRCRCRCRDRPLDEKIPRAPGAVPHQIDYEDYDNDNDCDPGSALDGDSRVSPI
jgi:hypothetical protein